MSRERSESARTRWSRRALTIPAYVVATLTVLAALPLLLPIAVCVDLLRRSRLAATRTLLFVAHYLVCETLGLVASLGLWIACVRSPEALERWSFPLQWRWAAALLRGACRLFGMRIEVEGEEALPGGPTLVFLRHVSIADTVLAGTLISLRTGLRLRYVMKRELLWDPCVDVVGQRLPNAFVRRGQGGSAREIGLVRELGRDLGPQDGVLIYPEGTRFTPERRERALARLAETVDPKLVDRARGLHRVLPPRLGGVLALLEAAPDADVLIGAHTGFESVRAISDLWNGALIGARIRVRFWRVPAAAVPREREARVDWLYDEWGRVDAWLAAAALQEAAP